MAKHTVTKWVVGLSSVLAFTGFVGFSRQADATKENAAAVQTTNVVSSAVQPASAPSLPVQVKPPVEKFASDSSDTRVQSYPEEKKLATKKYTKHKNDEDDDEDEDHEDHEDDDEDDDKKINRKHATSQNTSSVKRESVVKKTSPRSQQVSTQNTSYAKQETVKKTAARSRAS